MCDGDNIMNTGWSGLVPTDVGLIEVRLSPREVQILERVADGATNPAIASALVLSPATVKAHLYRIGKKFHTGDRAHMVLLALRAGMIS
ncbi:response regulator transcription factor [Actinomycetospora sp. C-140]